MNAEIDEAENDLRAIRGEKFPKVPRDRKFPEDIITLAIYLSRQLKILKHPVKLIPTAFAGGINPMPTARFKSKRKIKE